MRRRAFILLAALCTALVVHTPAASAANTAYVFAYFTESPNMNGADYGLHLAVSQDGLNWTPLNQNNPVVTPTAGTTGLRDPFVLRKQDGTFVILATDLKGTDFGQNNQYLHVWDSTDLTSFTGYRRIRMHNLATHTWAPTAFWDASRGQYGIVYSANNGSTDVFMVNYTSDFRTVSANQVYFSPGFPVLDGDIVVDGSTYYLYYKNLSTGLLYGARSTTGAPNSYTTYTSGLRQGNAIEAPLLLKNNAGSGCGCGATPSARSTTTTTPGPRPTSAATPGRRSTSAPTRPRSTPNTARSPGSPPPSTTAWSPGGACRTGCG
ncbi:glycoside hydrolase family 43 protein [Nonomuraea sp. NPDC050451]|uniref:glycoside hydrolase family 43 protein n=1 Tax=Nonomuraea sp. NPDC050451 TaxID=3364364 RepID=UPI003798A700